MQNGTFAACTTACGVTPQAQKTGSSSGLTSIASPQSGCARSRIPIASGTPMWTGAPCTFGKREVICTARIASAGLNGRIETTSGPWKRPAGTVGTFVRHIATFLPCSMCRSGTPASSSACSNENEQPRMNATRSSRHQRWTSYGSSTHLPFSNTR